MDELFTRGRVVSVSPAVNPGDRSIRVTIATDTLEESRTLIDGGFVTVWIETNFRDNALALPIEAVISRNNKNFAFVVDPQGVVHEQQVSIGLWGLEGFEITQGINQGDMVVTLGFSQK